MKIGILGGSFNPVHNGHIRLANSAIYELQLDKLIIIPAYIQPFKQDSKPVNECHRLKMLELAFSYDERVIISSYEIDTKGISYTYNTLTHFRDKYPKDDIYFIMGGDSVIKLSSWFNGEKLLNEFNFAVSLRPGTCNNIIKDKINEYKQKFNANIYEICEPMLDISSTNIRNCFINNRHDILNKLIPINVIKYIEENKLYV